MGYNESLRVGFPGMVVNKSILKEFKDYTNAPSYVIEYLVSTYCSSEDQDEIEAGKEYIRELLSENFAKPEMSDFIKMKIREEGSFRIIDQISAKYDEKKDIYVTNFANFKANGITMPRSFLKEYEKIIVGGVWAIIELSFKSDSQDIVIDDENISEYSQSPFAITFLSPIQIAAFDIDEFIKQRQYFTSQDWRYMILRSIGYEPSELTDREQLHLIERLVPLIEKNYNLCELGSRSTGKSFLYKNTSPYSILMTGGQTTIANMFYNMSLRSPGLIARWDCVAFDEVAGLKSTDKDLVNGLKDYMESGSIARGNNIVTGEASVVYNGNTDSSPAQMFSTSHLFIPFPQNMRDDSAFFDRIHYYLPGWESPKLTEKMFTKENALSVNIIAEFCHAMRSREYWYLIENNYKFIGSYFTRDEKAVKKTFSGLVKLLYPDGIITHDEIQELLEYAIEGRRRVKEQLKRMNPSEFTTSKMGYEDGLFGIEKIVECRET